MLDENTVIGPLVGLNTALRGGRYFIRVTNAGLTNFHFGIIAVPPLSKFSNDAGHSQEAPLHLGTLTRSLSHKNSFYTFFPRERIKTSSGPGQLMPNFSTPTPYAPTPDWYSFDLPSPRRLHLGSNSGPSYVFRTPQHSYAAWAPGSVLEFDQAGRYLLGVYDQKTRVTASGQLFVERDPKVENFEHYSFYIEISA
jgi:hypothetical protein